MAVMSLIANGSAIQINDIMEADGMLAERVKLVCEMTAGAPGTACCRDSVRGEAAALTRALRRRFGELSATDQARIAQAELAEPECPLDRR